MRWTGLRFESLTKTEALPEKELHIFLEVDPKSRTLTVHDNGIGMSRQEVTDHIGTIARSGTKEFLKLAREQKQQKLTPELIGQFGVGFYSTFMVARPGDCHHATLWRGKGDPLGVGRRQRLHTRRRRANGTWHQRHTSLEAGRRRRWSERLRCLNICSSPSSASIPTLWPTPSE